MLEDVKRQAADLGLTLTCQGRAWQCEGEQHLFRPGRERARSVSFSQSAVESLLIGAR